MLSRLFALMVLLALVLGGIYYWRSKPESQSEGLRAVGRELKDAALTGAVKAAFELNRNLKPQPIHVSTEDGVVTLRGDVSGVETKDLAEHVAAAVPDVRQVVNHLQVTSGPAASPRPERTLTEAVDDRALEVQVRLALSLNKQLKGTDIKIEVYKQAVTLSGDVPGAAQKALATQIARDTPGVSAVTDRIHALGQDDHPGR